MARHTRLARVCAIAGIAGALALAGCTPAPEPTRTATPTAEPAPSQTVPAQAALVAGGTAAENLPFFSDVVASVWAGAEQRAGRAYIDALTAAGFDKAAMQVTEDESTVGNQAESLQFSVRWGEECLIGQVGPATGEPVALVMPGLADGGCLIGATRVIDW